MDSGRRGLQGVHPLRGEPAPLLGHGTIDGQYALPVVAYEPRQPLLQGGGLGVVLTTASMLGR